LFTIILKKVFYQTTLTKNSRFATGGQNHVVHKKTTSRAD